MKVINFEMQTNTLLKHTKVLKQNHRREKGVQPSTILEYVTRKLIVSCRVFFLSALVLGQATLAASKPAHLVVRNIASLNFPEVNATNDQGDILDSYTAYLRFAEQIGQSVDHANTARLARLYQKLRQRDPNSAALFLKGLRFEMVQKVELLGVDPSRLSSQSPVMRRFVAKYMREWAREADEYLFRSLTPTQNDASS